MCTVIAELYFCKTCAAALCITRWFACVSCFEPSFRSRAARQVTVLDWDPEKGFAGTMSMLGGYRVVFDYTFSSFPTFHKLTSLCLQSGKKGCPQQRSGCCRGARWIRHRQERRANWLLFPVPQRNGKCHCSIHSCFIVCF